MTNVTQCFLDINGSNNIFSTTSETTLLILINIYLISTNVYAVFGICRTNRKKLCRTSKLMLHMCVIHLLISVSSISLATYYYINQYRSEWLVTLHISIIVWLSLEAVCNVFILTVDRYMLVVRGKCYLFWKKKCIFSIITLKSLNALQGICTFITLNLESCVPVISFMFCVVFFILIVFVLTLVSNIALIKYVRRKMSSFATVRVNAKRQLSITMTIITISVSFCEITSISFLLWFITDSFILKKQPEYGLDLIKIVLFVILFHCANFSFIYIIRNSDIKLMFCVRNREESFV